MLWIHGLVIGDQTHDTAHFRAGIAMLESVCLPLMTRGVQASYCHTHQRIKMLGKQVQGTDYRARIFRGDSCAIERSMVENPELIIDSWSDRTGGQLN